MDNLRGKKKKSELIYNHFWIHLHLAEVTTRIDKIQIKQLEPLKPQYVLSTISLLGLTHKQIYLGFTFLSF